MPQTNTAACNIAATAVAAAGATNPQISPSAAGQTLWVAGLSINGGGSTAGGLVTATLTGLIPGTLSIAVVVPVGAGVMMPPITLQFLPPLQAFPGNSVQLSVPSFGAGSLGQSAAIWGFSSPS